MPKPGQPAKAGRIYPPFCSTVSIVVEKVFAEADKTGTFSKSSITRPSCKGRDAIHIPSN